MRSDSWGSVEGNRDVCQCEVAPGAGGCGGINDGNLKTFTTCADCRKGRNCPTGYTCEKDGICRKHNTR